MTAVSHIPINERSQHLLKVLVERYIRDGQPVGSKTLALETSLSVSPATIRNILADLEEHGYLSSPHTSAGRVPTALGYRFFVDSLVTVRPLEKAVVEEFQQKLTPDQNVPALVTTVSNWLSELTHLTGLVMLPRREIVVLRHIEFLPLPDNRVLVILVLNEREVQNRIIQTNRTYSVSELQEAANYLSTTYGGQDVLTVRKKLLAEMQHERADMDRLMRTALDMADKVFDGPSDNKSADYVMAGQSHLLDLVDATGVVRLRQLFEAFTQKQSILHLLDQCLSTEGVQIFIGKEAGYDVLDECSVVTAPYKVDGQVAGMLGVVGPTRMPYERVISVVDVTAKLLSAALNQN
jgi:heat-inducible transcriptional repressor